MPKRQGTDVLQDAKRGSQALAKAKRPRARHSSTAFALGQRTGRPLNRLSRFALSADRDVNRTAYPELAIGIVAGEYRAGIETVAEMMFGGGVAEARFNRLIDLPDVPGVIDQVGIVGIVANIASRDRLDMPVAHVQFPGFDLLEEPDSDHVLVIAGGAIPAIQGVPVAPQPGPAKMLAQEQLRHNLCRAPAGGEDEALVIRAILRNQVK